ncbi:MAG TPA: hypothetical protein VFJ82_01280, partial [Longimicrobium sp.]|nr:hypothetical protein [Longimicrobium sp.]
MSSEWLDLHRQSERLAGEAQLSVAQDRGGAAELYRRAAEFEEAALAKIPADKVRTRGIIGVSATALWFKSGNLEQAERLGRRLLEETTLPAFARSEVQEILNDLRQSGAHAEAAHGRGARIYDVQVTLNQHYRVAATTRGAAEELAMQQWARGEHADASELVAVTTVEADRAAAGSGAAVLNHLATRKGAVQEMAPFRVRCDTRRASPVRPRASPIDPGRSHIPIRPPSDTKSGKRLVSRRGSRGAEEAEDNSPASSASLLPLREIFAVGSVNDSGGSG